MLEIEVVKPASQLGYVRIEGYTNDGTFSVTIREDNHALDYITLDREIVWADNHSLLEEPIKNPISAEMLSEIKHMVTTQIRTIRSRRR